MITVPSSQTWVGREIFIGILRSFETGIDFLEAPLFKEKMQIKCPLYTYQFTVCLTVHLSKLSKLVASHQFFQRDQRQIY